MYEVINGHHLRKSGDRRLRNGMNGREMIKALMEEKRITNATLAHRLGITQATIWERLNNRKTRDIPLSTFCDMIKALDCDLLVVPANKSGNIAGAMKITVDDAARINNGGRKKGTKVKNTEEGTNE